MEKDEEAHQWEVIITTPEGRKKYIATDTMQSILHRLKEYLIKQKNKL